MPVKSPNDLLTRDEILKLIDHAEKLRDKVLIACSMTPALGLARY
jgi:hypothetical protein